MQNLYREDLNNNFKYAWQYQEAYEILIKNHHGGSHLSMPILFTLRHYLELILKANIKYLSSLSKSDVMLKKLNDEHKLVSLSNAFLQHYTLAKKALNYDNQDKSHLEDFKLFKDIFIELDNYSSTFRYPHDKDGNILLPIESRNIGIKINQVYEKATFLLNNIEDMFPKNEMW